MGEAAAISFVFFPRKGLVNASTIQSPRDPKVAERRWTLATQNREAAKCESRSSQCHR